MTAAAAPAPPASQRSAPPDATPDGEGRAGPPPSGAAALASRVVLAGLGALCVLWAIVALDWPLGFDHGLYAWTGDVVARGGLAYRDAWDMHGPVVAYLFAAPELVFGHHFWGVRLVDAVLAAVGAWGVWRLVAHAGPAPSRTAAWWAAVVFALTYASLGYNETAQPDGWVGLVAAAAFAPALLAPGRRRGLVVAGLAVGLFTLVKPFYAAFGLVPALALLGSTTSRPSGAAPAPHRRPTVGDLLPGLLTLALAAVVPIALVLGYFATRGALADLVDVHLRYTTRVYNDLAALAPGSRLGGLVRFLWDGKVVPVALAAAVAGGAALWRRGERTLLAALVAWAALAVGFVLLQNKFYYYHWIPVLPPLAVLAAYGLTAVTRRGGDAAVLALATLGVITFHAALRPVAYVAQGALVAAGRMPRAAYRASFDEGNPSRPADRERAAAYLRRHTGSGDGVAVWGTDAGIVYLADRPTPFRLAGWYWPVILGRGSAVQRGYRDEYLRGLREHTPAYLVVNRAVARTNPAADLARHPEVRAAIDSAFVHDTTLGPFELLRRRGAQPPGPAGPR